MSWKTCSSCRRKEIDFGEIYWECSVSTCNRKRVGLFFCSVSCWEAHLPTMRHREAWAVEKTAPTQGQWTEQQADEAPKPAPRVATSSPAPARRTVAAAAPESDDDLPKDVLIVVSKLKKYVKARADMKTSETVIPALSDEIRRICDRAIRVAGEQGRKTILDRDVREALRQS